MRITFDNTSVHERAGVALVSITYYILLVSLGSPCKVPFQTGGEPCPSSSAKTRAFQDVYNVFRSHLREDLGKSCVPVFSYVLLYFQRIDFACISKCNPKLSVKENHVRIRMDFLLCVRSYIKKSVNYSPFQQMLLNYLAGVVRFQISIQDPFRIDNNDGAQFARTHTSCNDNPDFVGEALLGDFISKRLFNIFAS